MIRKKALLLLLIFNIVYLSCNENLITEKDFYINDSSGNTLISLGNNEIINLELLNG